MLRDILKGKDKGVNSAVSIIAHVAPDILLLTGVDWDLSGAALEALRTRLADEGQVYPYQLALKPNTGVDSGFDLDQNGALGEARDAIGWGKFTGADGMALLSKHPIGEPTDFTAFLWRDLPGAILPPDWYSDEVLDVLRLSTTGHWDVPIFVGDNELRVLTYYAGPPVFDGPEDRNGRRTHDESMFWARYLEGEIGAAPKGPVVVMGDANLDPSDGDGSGEAIQRLLSHPRLKDPLPRSEGAVEAATQGGANATHRGDASLDTVDWKDDGGPGNLRVDYVLPSKDLNIVRAGVFWPRSDDPLHRLLGRETQGSSRHRLVWVDVEFQGE